MAAVKYWVWLSALRGLSSRAACAVIDAFGGPMEAYFAPFDSYAALPDVTEKDASLLRQKDLSEAERILGECEEKNIRILTIRDADYPLRLQQIYDPPQVLYLRGKLPYLDEAPTIALVGTRKASPYGEKMAASLGYQIARGGGVVVTGMALGNDAAAARGALLGQGKCVGVLGSSIDVDYPRQNASLIADVAAVGCILSEYPPGYGGMNFPRRNRIISGLSSGVCVVEAPERSGALITAATALEQGRDVFAIPGPLDAEGSVGCNRLIRDGAGLATESWDILREYQSRYPHKLHPDGEKLPPLPKKSDIFYPERSKKPKVAPSGLPVINVRRNAEGLTDDQIKVLRILDDKEPMLTDDIALRANVPVRRILSAVTMLEIDGYTRQEGLRKFVRTVEVEDTKE